MHGICMPRSTPPKRSRSRAANRPKRQEPTTMRVFIFDLLAYGKHFDQYKQTKYLPYPLANDHYDREVAAQTYEQHLQAWEEMDKLGFDGVGLNEHHTTPHGMMNSPTMMSPSAAQRTRKLK